MYFSASKIRKLLAEAGADRISEEAVTELQRHIDKRAYEIAKKAVMLAKHAKRKTITVSDIKLAYS